MTKFSITNNIDELQMAVLLHLLKSWNMEVEVSYETVAPAKHHKLFSKTRGIWKDYNIDAKQLRRDAWGTEKLIRQ